MKALTKKKIGKTILHKKWAKGAKEKFVVNLTDIKFFHFLKFSGEYVRGILVPFQGFIPQAHIRLVCNSYAVRRIKAKMMRGKVVMDAVMS